MFGVPISVLYDDFDLISFNGYQLLNTTPLDTDCLDPAHACMLEAVDFVVHKDTGKRYALGRLIAGCVVLYSMQAMQRDKGASHERDRNGRC